MTTKNPEISPTLPPAVQAFFEQRSARYAAIADDTVKNVADAKAAAQVGDPKLLAGTPAPTTAPAPESAPVPTARPRRPRVRSVTPVPTEAPTPDITTHGRIRSQNETGGVSGASEQLADTGASGSAEVLRFGDLNREELFAEFQAYDFINKVKRLQFANKALRNMMESVVRFHGFNLVKAAVRDLDGKSLIFKKTGESLEQAFGGAWKAKQFKGIDPDKLFLEYHDVLVATEEVLENLHLQHSDQASEDSSRLEALPLEKLEEKFPGLLDEIRTKAREWENICSSIEGQQVKSFIQAVRDQLELVGVPHVKRIADELTFMKPDHGWRGETARNDMLRAIRFHGTLKRLVEAGQSLSSQFPQKVGSVEVSGKGPVLATPDAAVSSSSAVPAARETSASMGGDAMVAKRLGFLEDLRSRFLDRYNAASLRLDEVERSAKDDRQYRALRETLASIQADFQLISDPVTLQRYAAGEMEVASGSTKVSDGYLDIVDQLKTLTERVELVGRSLGETAAEKESKREAEAEFRERLERVKDLITMGAGIRQYVGTRWEKQLLPELQKRASGQYRYYNIAGIQKWLVQEEEIHQWHGDKAVQAKRRLIDETLPMLEEMVGHMRDIATEMRDAGEISQRKDAKALSLDMVREARLARERFEQKLEQTVVAFAANLDGKLRQQGKDATYRMSALLSHLPTVVDALIEKLKGNLVLSPAEKKAMLKQCNAAVIDSVSD